MLQLQLLLEIYGQGPPRSPSADAKILLQYYTEGRLQLTSFHVAFRLANFWTFS